MYNERLDGVGDKMEWEDHRMEGVFKRPSSVGKGTPGGLRPKSRYHHIAYRHVEYAQFKLDEPSEHNRLRQTHTDGE